jgi:hypothetical protein
VSQIGGHLNWLQFPLFLLGKAKRMNRALKEVIERAETWPESAQAALVEIAREIEDGLAGDYEASDEDLRAIDEARTAVRRDRERRGRRSRARQVSPQVKVRFSELALSGLENILAEIAIKGPKGAQT